MKPCPASVSLRMRMEHANCVHELTAWSTYMYKRPATQQEVLATRQKRQWLHVSYLLLSSCSCRCSALLLELSASPSASLSFPLKSSTSCLPYNDKQMIALPCQLVFPCRTTTGTSFIPRAELY